MHELNRITIFGYIMVTIYVKLRTIKKLATNREP
jgi:hypothetical protein